MSTVPLINIMDYLMHLDSRINHMKADVAQALDSALSDIQYHFPTISSEASVKRIIQNSSEAAIFLYRLGRLYFEKDLEDKIGQMHGLLRSTCACEIYFSTRIDIGFHLTHSIGTVIGSRNTIGKGFIAYQNCTIGHDHDDQNGAIIGDQVTLMPYSSIIGDITVGDNVIIGAYTMVKRDVPSNTVLAGIPGKVVNRDATDISRRVRPNLR